MYRYILILITTIIAISGCSLPGVQDEGADLETNTVVFENDNIHVLIPKTWSGTSNSNIPSPRIGTLEIAYVSPEIKSGFSNNFLVLRDTLDRIVTSTRYSELNNAQTMKNYFDYKLIQTKDFIFSDNETSRLYVFEAQYNQTTPKMKFIQTARVCGTKVYLLHFSLTLDKNPDNYSKLLESFTCK